MTPGTPRTAPEARQAARLQRAALSRPDSLLLTDLYQLNMMQAYLDRDMTETAVFELFIRKLPDRRGFLMAAGLEQAATFLEEMHLSEDELDWIDRSGRFSKDFVDWLADLRFEGDLHAIPEGTVVFPDEPFLRVTAPLPVAQLVESRLLASLQAQIVVASKAARIVLAAEGRTVLDFGLRRANGTEAGLLAARAAYIAGTAGTATVLAEPAFGIPIFGTMAHSFVQAHDDEADAFRHFARSRPDQTTLLIDTYDTEEGARKVVAIAPELAREGITIRGVRLDSGDLADHARKVRRILDDGGLGETMIFASGGLDEDKIAGFVREGAPIDGFGVGSSLVTSSDAPTLDTAYKLQEYAGLARRKRSEGKATWPGAKQVWRSYDDNGRMTGDRLGLADEEGPDGAEPLVRPVLEDGKRVGQMPTLEDARERASAQLAALPDGLARLGTDAYPVEVSQRLRDLAAEVDRRIDAGEQG
jgi:nicotinate phosphoribosyltransferase